MDQVSQRTITEINELLVNGFQHNGWNVHIRIANIVCDSPAKATVKTKKILGYYGCDCCDQKGEWDGKHIIYKQKENLTLRTDESYQQKVQPEHHKAGAQSHFMNLPIDMVRTFPMDYMHCVCLGVTRRFILLWMNGEHRLSRRQLAEIDKRLIEMRCSITSDFARKPHPFSEVAHWKATEFRQFLLYTGKFILVAY